MFLRQVVADPSIDLSMLVLADELLGIRAGLRMRRAVGIALERDRRHGDRRCIRKTTFDFAISRFALFQAEAPTVIMNDDRDVIGIVERSGATLERCIVEGPLRRGKLPD